MSKQKIIQEITDIINSIRLDEVEIKSIDIFISVGSSYNGHGNLGYHITLPDRKNVCAKCINEV